ncbi:hypothetical protein HHK36_027987 [Tetracentron sinense]|uniref:J domain-containing protein n=1 Tax=Tetracentron sinense TaxID=13715 RepID=A0A835D216_TETSI|nr:hypothetical protein HHK36_027987 [Tetracentron sinense]
MHIKFQMKDTATENFQRIREAYEILTDEHKRQIYDIYGMEGLTSGLELGPKLNKAEEIKEEFERLRRQKEQEKVSSHVRTSGSVLANLSLPQFLNGDGIMRGYTFTSFCFFSALEFVVLRSIIKEALLMYSKNAANVQFNFVNLRMAMTSEVQSQISKRNTIAVGGNLAVTGNSGGGAATAVLRHQISSVSSVEVMASAGLRALIGVQTTR